MPSVHTIHEYTSIECHVSSGYTYEFIRKSVELYDQLIYDAGTLTS